MLATAEEGGSGHYMPGSMSSFVDGVPTEETFIARYNFLLWDAEVEANRTLPIAGLLTAGADITSYANGLTLLWRPSWGSINDRWSYALLFDQPFGADTSYGNGPMTGPALSEKTDQLVPNW